MSKIRVDVTIHMANGRVVVQNCYPPVVNDMGKVAEHIKRIVDYIAPGAKFSTSNQVVEDGSL